MNARRLLLPLASLVSMIAVAACQGNGTNPGTPVSGTLTESHGTSGPLTLDPSNVGGSFSVHAVLGSASIAGTGAFGCFAPDPPTYPNYDIQGTDSTTYGLFISIIPSAWTVGSHAIDGTNVQLVVVSPDRYGAATGGRLVLTTADLAVDTPGNVCSFYTTGAIPLVGRID